MLIELTMEVRRRDGTIARLDRSVEHHDRRAVEAFTQDVQATINQATASVARDLHPEAKKGIERDRDRPAEIHLADREGR